jgi:hypothetical protein
MKNVEQKQYQYIITVKKPIWPRKLADILSYTELRDEIVSIQDVQNDKHIYRDTYIVEGGDE